MTRTVNCVILGKKSPCPEEAPYPGVLGERIYQNVSAEAWLERLVMTVNEHQLNSADNNH